MRDTASACWPRSAEGHLVTAWAAIGAAHLDRIARASGPVALGSSNPASVAVHAGGPGAV